MTTSPAPSRAKMTPVHRGSSAHANGGATGVEKRFSLAARHRFFWQDKRNGVEWQQGATTTTQGNGAHAQSPDNHQAPPQSRAKMSNDHRGRSAHANGGAAEVKRRFSLAARHRFFGQAPKKWGRIAGQANDYLPKYRRTRTRAAGVGFGSSEGAFWRVFCLLPRTCNYCIIESCELAKILCI